VTLRAKTLASANEIVLTGQRQQTLAGLAARTPAESFMTPQNVEAALCEETTQAREALRFFVTNHESLRRN
jgi:hypothetical protein